MQPGPAEGRLVSVVSIGIHALTPDDHDRVAAAVASFGGTMPPSRGGLAAPGHHEEVLTALFGVPLSHEDDAIRAAMAAFTIHDAINRARIGISTGEVLSVEPVSGDVLDEADALRGKASAGQLLVASETAALIGESADLRRLPSGGLAATRRRTAHRRPASRSPFVDRIDEMALLEAAVSSALDDVRPTLVSVLGEPGVGKSRLVGELAARVARRPGGLDVVVGRCPPYGPHPPFAPLGDLARDILSATTHPGPVGARLTELGLTGATMAARLQILWSAPEDPVVIEHGHHAGLAGRAPGTGEPGLGRDDPRPAFRELVLAAARHRPLLIILEDAHLASPETLSVLDELGAARGRHALAIVSAGRPEMMEAHPSWGRRWKRTALLTVEPLSLVDAAHLLDALVGRRPIESQLRNAVLERAGGNPFFLETMVGALTDGTADSGVASDGLGIPIPTGLRAAVSARLDTLPEAERMTARYASVIGHRFTLPEVADLLHHDRPGIDVAAAAEGLVWRDLWMADTNRYQFRHGLAAEVAYRGLPKAERAMLHRRAADSAAGVADLARHLDRAVVLGAETGQVDDELRKRAVAAMATAGTEAARLGTERKAVEWLRRALAHAEGDPGPRRWPLLRELGWALAQLHQVDEARAALEEMRREAQAAGADQAVAEALAGLGTVERLSGRIAAARRALRSARHLFRAMGDRAGVAHTLILEADVDLFTGRTNAALLHLSKGRALLHEVGDVPGAALASGREAFARFILGDFDAAAAQLEWAGRELDEHEKVDGVLYCRSILGFVLWAQGRLTEALAVAELMTGTGPVLSGFENPWAVAMRNCLEAMCLLDAARHHDAATAIDAAVAGFAEMSDPWGAAVALMVLGTLQATEGRMAEARTQFDRSLRRLREVGDRHLEGRVLMEMAEAAAGEGRSGEARAHAHAVLTLVRGGVGDREREMAALTLLAELARGEGGHPTARALLEEALAAGGGRAERSTSERRTLARLSAVLLEMGDVEAARQRAEEAVSMPGEAVRVAALAHLALAAVLIRCGDQVGAADTLNQARRLVEGTDAGAERSDIDAALAAL